MATDNIVKVNIGVPGPTGAGVTPAEKATFLTNAGGTLVGALKFTPAADGSFVLYEQDDGTDLVVLDTTNKELKLYAGMKLRFFSDAGTTEEASIDGATGAMQSDATVDADGGITGDTVVWPIVIDGGGSTITTGVKGHMKIPYDALVTSWEITGDQSGSIVVDFWQDTYANFPPTNADSITTSEEPTLSTAIKNTDMSLNSGNGWALTGGSYLMWNVDSVSTVTRVCIALTVVRT